MGIASKLAAARNEKIYLVGGYIRDLLLGRMTYDMDFALDGNAKKFSSELAKKIGAKFFVLDEKTQTFRITCSGRACSARWNIDISKMQGKDIIADLKRRDFSIDAMAIDLNNGHCESKPPNFTFAESRLSGRAESRLSGRAESRRSNLVVLIDPFSGLKDLKKRIIRVTSPGVLNDDPLRLLRAFRLAATLGFKIESRTLKAISVRSSLIKKVSRERIRDELFKILPVDNSYEYISQIDKSCLLERIIPQIKKMKQERGLWMHSLLTLRFLENLLRKNRLERIWSTAIASKTKIHLRNEVSTQNTRGTLLKFVSLFHDIGKPSTKKMLNGKMSFIGHDRVGEEILRKISEYLRLSNKEIKVILKIARYHMRVHYLANLSSITKRAVVRLIRDADEETIELLLFTLADFLATPRELKKPTLKKNQEVTKKIIRQYFKFKESRKFVRLVTGDDLIKKFHMKEGPRIGRILEEIELAQREGPVKTRKEALHLVSNLLNHSSFNP